MYNPPMLWTGYVKPCNSKKRLNSRAVCAAYNNSLLYYGLANSELQFAHVYSVCGRSRNISKQNRE